MTIIFASDFRIELTNIPDEILKYLNSEIDLHILSGRGRDQFDILIDFVDEIEIVDKINYFTLGAAFSEKSFYLFDSNHKIRIDNFRENNYILVEKHFSPVLFFDLLEYIYMHNIIEKDKMFLHSSGVLIGDKAFVFPDCSGDGKTKTLIQMLINYNATFLGDDWTIIDNKGNIYPYLKRIHLWPNDIIEHKEVFKKDFIFIPWLIDGYFDSTKKGNRLLELIKRLYSKYLNRHLPIKLQPSDINSDMVDCAHCQKIDYIVFFSLSNVTQINHESIDASTLTEKIIAVTLFENRKRLDYEDWAIFANQSDLDSRNEWIDKIRSIINGCSQRTENIWLDIPFKASANDIAAYIYSNIM